MLPSTLVLETGEVFEGYSPDWQASTVFGEIVFNTGMVGYVECLSDPSYTGQILTFTYPIIGNYGVPEAADWESHKLHARGIIVSELAEFHARPHAAQSLLEACKEQGVAMMVGVDTRALTKVLRDRGCVAGAIVTTDPLPKAFPNINAQHLVSEVSIKAPIESGNGDVTIIAVDCGMKENIWRHLQKLPIKIKRVPHNYDYTNEPYDGVFLSNGPGDPMMCVETIAILRKAMQKNKPIFGICLGSQLMGLAIGAKTYKMRFGHRSQNQPCLQEGTERCFLTSQNHGFAIDEQTLPEGWRVTFRNLNDATVQGIEHESLPYSSVQFHPEAAPGPTDTHWLFDKFYQLVKDRSK
ncbi:MAG: glutamine-hydrolyzing carbamoyl-phosphate synthase small subunit [Gammaproteobacteria bacterium]|nr:glutamine-hydrolyzing carbamoyl-phosphate synthase small subunit [Gammaproteobacteria bacterium]